MCIRDRIYTSTTPELIELVEQEVKKQLGDDVELYSCLLYTSRNRVGLSGVR